MYKKKVLAFSFGLKESAEAVNSVAVQVGSVLGLTAHTEDVIFKSGARAVGAAKKLPRSLVTSGLGAGLSFGVGMLDIAEAYYSETRDYVHRGTLGTNGVLKVYVGADVIGGGTPDPFFGPVCAGIGLFLIHSAESQFERELGRKLQALGGLLSVCGSESLFWTEEQRSELKHLVQDVRKNIKELGSSFTFNKANSTVMLAGTGMFCSLEPITMTVGLFCMLGSGATSLSNFLIDLADKTRSDSYKMKSLNSDLDGIIKLLEPSSRSDKVLYGAEGEIDPALTLAETLFRSGRFEKAAELIDHSQSEHLVDRPSVALYIAGISYVEMGQFEKAYINLQILRSRTESIDFKGDVLFEGELQSVWVDYYELVARLHMGNFTDYTRDLYNQVGVALNALADRFPEHQQLQSAIEELAGFELKINSEETD
jgi:hypothetical protein